MRWISNFYGYGLDISWIFRVRKIGRTRRTCPANVGNVGRRAVVKFKCPAKSLKCLARLKTILRTLGYGSDTEGDGDSLLDNFKCTYWNIHTTPNGKCKISSNNYA